MLDLPARDLVLLQLILAPQVPGNQVLAFGSRVKGKARKFSDLDLTLDAGERLPWLRIGDLKEALSESALAIVVDVIDLVDVSERFREMVLRQAISLPTAFSAS